jgi:hypothetical protein
VDFSSNKSDYFGRMVLYCAVYTRVVKVEHDEEDWCLHTRRSESVKFFKHEELQAAVHWLGVLLRRVTGGLCANFRQSLTL